MKNIITRDEKWLYDNVQRKNSGQTSMNFCSLPESIMEEKLCCVGLTTVLFILGL